MKLAALHPVLEDGALIFDCPKCQAHRIRLPMNPPITGGWVIGKDASHQDTSLALGNLTLTPSIATVYPHSQHPCDWHGFITNGETVPA